MALSTKTQQRMSPTSLYSNTTNTKRKKLYWLQKMIKNNKRRENTSKGGEWKLQSSDTRRQYLRRGSKSSCMLRIPIELCQSMPEHDGSGISSLVKASTVSSNDEFSIHTSPMTLYSATKTEARRGKTLRSNCIPKNKPSHVISLTLALANARIDTTN
eukprot:scaffold26716_cov137-Cylindrotheca_fusiformis.AAC.7